MSHRLSLPTSPGPFQGTSRRLLCTAAAAGLLSALLPTTPAYAAPAAALVVAPDHGIPGAALAATVTVTECASTAVSLTGAYVDVDGDDATTPAVAATRSASDENVWNADLAVPADAARTSLSEEKVVFTATATCDDAPPAAAATTALRTAPRAAAAALETSGTASVTVDDLAAAVLTLSPGRVERGRSFTYSVTGCTGGLADLFLVDAAGKDLTIPESTLTSQTATTFKGTFTVPPSVALGAAGVAADCAQAGSADATVTVFVVGATPPPGNGGGAPVAAPVPGRPTFTG